MRAARMSVGGRPGAPHALIGAADSASLGIMQVKVGPAIELAKKYGPQLGTAVAAIGTFLAKNPKVSTWAQEHLDDLPKRLAVVLQRRGDAAKIRGVLEVTRDSVRTLRSKDAERVRDVADGWVTRADDLELVVGLAEHLGASERRRTLARLRTKADALLAEVIEFTTGA